MMKTKNIYLDKSQSWSVGFDDVLCWSLEFFEFKEGSKNIIVERYNSLLQFKWNNNRMCWKSDAHQHKY